MQHPRARAENGGNEIEAKTEEGAHDHRGSFGITELPQSGHRPDAMFWSVRLRKHAVQRGRMT
jgi:hypothetical protein